MMKKTMKCVVAASVVAFMGAAYAGNRPGAVTVGVGQGYYIFSAKRDLQNTDIPEIRLGYDFSSRWGVVFVTDVINTEGKGTPPWTNHVHGFIYTLDGVYRFAKKGLLEPYVVAGIGVTSLKPVKGSNTVNNANVNAGIGAQYFISESIALGGDVRDIYTLSGGINDVAAVAHITFLFGGDTAPAIVYKGDQNS